MFPSEKIDKKKLKQGDLEPLNSAELNEVKPYGF